MKTVYLVRHGKSSWENMQYQDYERPLIDKGISRTRKIAGFLSDKKVVPDMILSSHAVRAFETAKLLATKLNYPIEKIKIDENLYFLGQQAMENILLGLDDGLKEVMLVGHNPDMTNFVNLFLDKKIDYLPTTGVVCVRFDTNHWNEVFLAKREIPFVITPKAL
jgi:phosphohistidine phosphatase